eukprot:CAMPEP_0114126700 /NCGR_PEP_ID=MMETSP0043_2-20121206/9968_1 /TAXON_ID=464988 /ORGANISM="Hemiselmis andersenii, Strain CCMP644" /LENGTH=217 /DNA_ID=CAMNT_0001219699 /DNA_START=72 /DNA_END=725 /DNA_ORIENTATION=-
MNPQPPGYSAAPEFGSPAPQQPNSWEGYNRAGSPQPQQMYVQPSSPQMGPQVQYGGTSIPRGQVLAQYGEMPGESVEEARSKPHRVLSEEECLRYNLPAGSIMMASREEIAAGGQVPYIEQAAMGSEQDQIKAYLQRSGMIPWTGPKQAVFLNGEPVPRELYSYDAIPHAPDGYMGTVRAGKSPPPAGYSSQPGVYSQPQQPAPGNLPQGFIQAGGR